MTYLDMAFCTNADKCPLAENCKRNFNLHKAYHEVTISQTAFGPVGKECAYYWPIWEEK